MPDHEGSDEGLSECPYCQIMFPLHELDDHVQAHMLDEEEAETAAASLNLEALSIPCHECQQDVPHDEWESHQLVHRYLSDNI